jgi:pimeloyl-ACP methyl ester carboxylesterase
MYCWRNARTGRSLRALHATTAALTALTLSTFVVFATASVASAAPVEGPGGSEFYIPPTSVPTGATGELFWYRPTTENLNVALPANKAWKVLYQSSNQQGTPDWVTGTVMVPTAAWKGKGPRPVVSYGIGTQGIAKKCAPSLQMEEGTEYDGGAAIAALKAGYAVAITDYQGYAEGAVFQPYLDGKSEGDAVLDAVRAARQLPESGITESNPVIAWGYSQGGQAAGWAGELQPSYAPDVKLIGVAAGGTPSNLQAVASFGNGSVAAGFALLGPLGLHYGYPTEFPFIGEFSNSKGQEVGIKLLTADCAIQALKEFRGLKFEELTTGERSFQKLEEEFPVIPRVLKEQSLGTKKISVPVYHYHGLEDEFVPVTQDVELHQEWCSLGVTDDFQLYPGDHLLTDPTAIPDVMKWIEERVAGKSAPTTCGLHKAGAALPSTARLTPETGDLVIPLPAWQLTGSVTEKKSGISIEIPKGSTLTAHGDVTNETLAAELAIAPINQTISVLGLPITVKGSLTPTEKVFHGKVSLSNEGVLSQTAEGAANMKVSSAAVGILQLPIGCTTKEPIKLPLSITEPVNALETGGFAIKTEVTVPEFGGCGLVGPVLSSLMSGPENPINITATPPPPVNW